MEKANSSMYEMIERLKAQSPPSTTTYACQICRDDGWIPVKDEGGNERMTPCKCLIRAQAQKRLKASGLEGVIEDLTFDTYKTDLDFQKYIQSAAEQFCSQTEIKGFYIGGQVGCGKTHICTAMCGRFLERGESVVYAVYRLMMLDLKGNANNDAEYNKILSGLVRPKVLYIDDLFKTKKGETIQRTDIEHTFTVINYRYINKLTTIISSEKTLKEIIDIDEAIGSRIKQMCGDKFDIRINPDMRKNWRLK